MKEFFQNNEIFQSPYFKFAVIVPFVFFGMLIVRRFINKRSDTNVKNQKIRTLLDESLSKNTLIIALLASVLMGITALPLGEKLLKIIQNLLLTLILLSAYFPIRNIFREIFDILQRSKRTRVSFLKDKNLSTLTRRFTQVMIFVLFLTMLLSIWGLQIGPILTGLGIAGVAAGLALQGTLSNIFGGISMIIDNSFAEGDFIELPDGLQGTVKEIGYRSTRIMTYNHEMIMLPNGDLEQKNVKNLSRPKQSYRLELDVNISYQSDVLKAKAIIEKTVRGLNCVLKEPEPEICFYKMSEYSLWLKVFCTIENPQERYRSRDKIYAAIFAAFGKNKIQIPFPTSTVYLKTED